MKWLTIACAACIVAVLLTAWWRLGDRDIAVPTIAAAAADGAGAGAAAADPRRSALTAARRSCDPAALDAFVEGQRVLIARSPRQAAALLLGAEALLERVLLRNHLRGMTVGEPLYDEVPPASAEDIEQALEWLARARELGAATAEALRIEADLLSNRITGLGSALQWNGRIQAALAEAAQLDADSPALHVTLGLRKLLAPTWLGHDPEKALDHLEFAARTMPDDERPSLFAAMAAFLLQKRQQAIGWLERAVARNPNNRFARVVLERVRRGEPEPFGRDVDPAAASVAPAPAGDGPGSRVDEPGGGR